MIVELEEGIELNPCPFCGVAPVLKTDTPMTGVQFYWVKCAQCGATQTAQNDRQMVISIWNGGHPPP